MKRIFLLAALLLSLAATAQAQVHLQTSAEGWQIVADQDPTFVLAYGSSAVDPQNLPAPMAYMMAQYAEALTTSPLTAVKSQLKAPARRVTYANIGPLVSSHWAQDAPFNDLCPEHPGSGGRICLTGCVATAMAQVLHYHRKPVSCSGYKSYGLTQGNQRIYAACDYASLSFRWDLMQDTYTATSTAQQRRAVAELMQACGVAASMGYSYKLSTADPIVAANGINSFFDGVSARVVDYSPETVMSELRAGRPVLYSGSNSREVHCFVVDGATSAGYFHCNLGHGGEGDGNYLPTNLGGYPTAQNLLLISPTSGRPTYSPISELQGKYASSTHQPATSIEANRWYILWNSGRGGSPYSSGTGSTVQNTGNMPSAQGEPTSENAGQLVRFIPSGSGYYIQTGLGDYLGYFSPNGGTGTTSSSRSTLFQVGTIRSGYFSLRCGGNAYIDTNGIGKTVVGWSTTAPTDTLSNSAWRLFPVSITSAPNPPQFSSTATFTLQNTGYSQGYLVALTTSDQHPTLRGVTQDHAQGLYSGARYHDAVDFESLGARWRIITEGGQQYLQNCLTQCYLANKGDRTPYEFTSQKTPIHIARGTGGTYTFNSGTNAQSYLCAATQLANPAAFWEATDAGSLWRIEPIEEVAMLEGLRFPAARYSLMRGETVQLTAQPIPATAVVGTLQWASSDPTVATVTPAGLVTAVGPGTAQITVSTTLRAPITAVCTIEVGAATQVTQGKTALRAGDIYMLRCADSNLGYLAASPGSEVPMLHGVAADTYCYAAAYHTDASSASPYDQWSLEQISYDASRDIFTCALRNMGTDLYLTDRGKSTAYVLSAEPAAVTVLGSAADFSLRVSSLNYLTADPSRSTPAYYSNGTTQASHWFIYRVGEITGVERRDLTPVRPQSYDLTPLLPHGIVITNGKKVLR